MEYRNFGATGLRVSAVGFGAWAIGGPAMAGTTPIGWGESDDAVSRHALERAREAGITFFDTADFYGLGHSEHLIGATFGNRPDVVIATKVGHRQGEGGEPVLDYSADHIRKACEGSLRRLRRESIDYYQLHSARLTHLTDGECVDAMEQLRSQGKIRYWGISLNTFHPDPEGDFLISRGAGHGIQVVVNVLNQRAVPLVRRASQAGYGVIARMPLQFGLLAGKYGPDTRFPPDDHRSFRLTPEVLATSLDALEEVWPIAAELGVGKDSFSLSYAASLPGVSTVIPGIRTPEQADRNAARLVRLSDSQLDTIAELYTRRLAEVVALMERNG